MVKLKLRDFIKVVNKNAQVRIDKVCWDDSTNSVYNEKAFTGLAKEVKNKSLLDLRVSQLEFFCNEWLVWLDGFGW